MKIHAVYNAYNEVEYAKRSLIQLVPYVDTIAISETSQKDGLTLSSDGTHEDIQDFIKEYQAELDDHLGRTQKGEDIESSECFADRFKLIHEYRRLPYFDPDLPEELLPKNWLRSQASALFHEYHDLLAEKASKYFDSVLKAY